MGLAIQPEPGNKKRVHRSQKSQERTPRRDYHEDVADEDHAELLSTLRRLTRSETARYVGVSGGTVVPRFRNCPSADGMISAYFRTPALTRCTPGCFVPTYPSRRSSLHAPLAVAPYDAAGERYPMGSSRFRTGCPTVE